MSQTQQIQAIRNKTGSLLALAAVSAIVSAACVAIPMFVIRPFRPQGARELETALAVRHAGPWLAGVCVAVVLLAIFLLWKTARIGTRIGLICLLLLTFAGAVLTQVNIFEKMFHPYDSPSFEGADEAKVDSDDKVLAVTVGQEARAYPIRTMGYHHIVNDTVGGVPIAVTYCTLCHTGLVWSRVVDGKLLHFRLAGINNGNALLRDEQTSSIWQQSTGEAIFGPLKGQQLKLVRSDELTFALWKSEQPHGQVLKADPLYAAEYDPKDWEKHVEKTPTVVNTTRSGIAPHQLMLGVTVAGQSKAYPIESILAAKLIQDRVGDQPLIVVLGRDGASIRVFEGALESRHLTFAQGTGDQTLTDIDTGSLWNFQGCAIEGSLAGRCLAEIDAHKDYWFDWMNHHPESAVFKN
ncbi:DUF3179 domain-containing (seleno)protein [Tunturibacter empetritectus]|uniref:DUF3179 domain-containing protein n=1 Tax=Tunturiibacter lichenicola TaxID=2051959 RepID=A0A7W8N2M2_9BACT|nr:DUF3179 domain-containing (seleno)protein [Edaphobacter lichenicola]MBB5343219.1 hypothetical protein [Edaphobacter lichenicola]